MTPPATPSRTAVNGISHQSSTPYQQHLSTPHTVYPPIFVPVQANVRQSIVKIFKIKFHII